MEYIAEVFFGNQPAAMIWTVLARFLLVGLGALTVVRLMGNRSVGQLSPFDFVIMVGVGDLIISGAMDQKPTVFYCLTVLFVLLALQQLMGYLSLKSLFFRRWLEGAPVLLIQDGQLLKDNMRKTHFNYDDLRQELHKQGLDMTDLKNIRLARLESCGTFSVILEPQAAPLAKCDLEEFFKNIYDNPLSLPGEKWAKIEKMMTDLDYVANYLKGEAQKKPETERPNSEEALIADSYIN